MKKTFEEAKLELIRFAAADILTTSTIDGGSGQGGDGNENGEEGNND